MSASSLVVDLYDVIGDACGTSTARSVRDVLKGSPNAKSITCRINSPGGNVFDGIAIYNLLKEHPASVTVQIDALAASIASVIAMAGDKRCMASNAMMMLHNPSALQNGDAESLRKTSELLDKTAKHMAQIYSECSSMSMDEVLRVMNAETWFTATEALKVGLIDEIVAAKAAA